MDRLLSLSTDSFQLNGSSKVPVKVIVNIKPNLQDDTEVNEQDYCVIQINPKTLKFIPTDRGTREEEKIIEVDHLFNGNTSTSTQINGVTLGCYEDFVRGFNTTLLAVGASQTGKTYTLNEIVPLGFQSVFNFISCVEKERKYIDYYMEMSFCELYNNSFYDLLRNAPRSERKRQPKVLQKLRRNSIFKQEKEVFGSKADRELPDENLPAWRLFQIEQENDKIEIRESPDLGVFLTAAVSDIKHHVKTFDEALKLFEYGQSNSSKRPIDENSFSSRGHTILTLYLECRSLSRAPFDSFPNSVVENDSEAVSVSIGSGNNSGQLKNENEQKSWIHGSLETTDIHSQLTLSKLHIVDIAAAQRMKSAKENSNSKRSSNSDIQFNEMKFINLSLSCFGHLLSALAKNCQIEMKQKQLSTKQIPFQDFTSPHTPFKTPNLKTRSRSTPNMNNSSTQKSPLSNRAPWSGNQKVRSLSRPRNSVDPKSPKTPKSPKHLNSLNSPPRSPTVQFVPYLNSKLTHLLKESLGGRSRTVLLALINSEAQHCAMTRTTLKFAEWAKMIRTDPYSINPLLVSDLRQEKDPEALQIKKLLRQRSRQFESLHGLRPKTLITQFQNPVSPTVESPLTNFVTDHSFETMNDDGFNPSTPETFQENNKTLIKQENYETERNIQNGIIPAAVHEETKEIQPAENEGFSQSPQPFPREETKVDRNLTESNNNPINNNNTNNRHPHLNVEIEEFSDNISVESSDISTVCERDPPNFNSESQVHLQLQQQVQLQQDHQYQLLQLQNLEMLRLLQEKEIALQEAFKCINCLQLEKSELEASRTNPEFLQGDKMASGEGSVRDLTDVVSGSGEGFNTSEVEEEDGSFKSRDLEETVEFSDTKKEEEATNVVESTSGVSNDLLNYDQKESSESVLNSEEVEKIENFRTIPLLEEEKDTTSTSVQEKGDLDTTSTFSKPKEQQQSQGNKKVDVLDEEEEKLKTKKDLPSVSDFKKIIDEKDISETDETKNLSTEVEKEVILAEPEVKVIETEVKKEVDFEEVEKQTFSVDVQEKVAEPEVKEMKPEVKKEVEVEEVEKGVCVDTFVEIEAESEVKEMETVQDFLDKDIKNATENNGVEEEGKEVLVEVESTIDKETQKEEKSNFTTGEVKGSLEDLSNVDFTAENTSFNLQQEFNKKCEEISQLLSTLQIIETLSAPDVTLSESESYPPHEKSTGLKEEEEYENRVEQARVLRVEIEGLKGLMARVEGQHQMTDAMLSLLESSVAAKRRKRGSWLKTVPGHNQQNIQLQEQVNQLLTTQYTQLQHVSRISKNIEIKKRALQILMPSEFQLLETENNDNESNYLSSQRKMASDQEKVKKFTLQEKIRLEKLKLEHEMEILKLQLKEQKEMHQSTSKQLKLTEKSLSNALEYTVEDDRDKTNFMSKIRGKNSLKQDFLSLSRMHREQQLVQQTRIEELTELLRGKNASIQLVVKDLNEKESNICLLKETLAEKDFVIKDLNESFSKLQRELRLKEIEANDLLKKLLTYDPNFQLNQSERKGQNVTFQSPFLDYSTYDNLQGFLSPMETNPFPNLSNKIKNNSNVETPDYSIYENFKKSNSLQIGVNNPLLYAPENGSPLVSYGVYDGLDENSINPEESFKNPFFKDDNDKNPETTTPTVDFTIYDKNRVSSVNSKSLELGFNNPMQYPGLKNVLFPGSPIVEFNKVYENDKQFSSSKEFNEGFENPLSERNKDLHPSGPEVKLDFNEK